MLIYMQFGLGFGIWFGIWFGAGLAKRLISSYPNACCEPVYYTGISLISYTSGKSPTSAFIRV